MKSLLLCHLLVLLVWICTSQRWGSKQMKCERITIPLCQKIEYNLTYVPNMFEHPTQTDAALHAHQFWPLVRINCSPDLKLFICATHAPVCELNYGKPLLPCRSFCERVRDACSPVIKTHGMSWPEYLDCNKFPERGETTVCMEKDFGDIKGKVKRPDLSEGRNRSKPVRQPKQKMKTKERGEPVDRKKKQNVEEKRIAIEKPRKKNKQKSETCGCMCQKPFAYVNKSVGDGPSAVPSCALRCNEYFFSRSQQNLTTFWITLWSFLCLISTFITCLTAVIDSNRFKYPERPVIFISFSYFMISIGFIIRLARGFENIACNSSTKLLRYSATGPADCTMVFLLTYFFGMASCIWWVILALNWFLTAGMKWTCVAVTAYSQYFHFIAWFVPTVQSMAIMALAAIDSDPVAGICYVGNHDNAMLTIFVIAPQLVFLTLGSSFVIAGILALIINSRLAQKHNNQSNRSPKIDRSLLKIGAYAVLFVVPITVTVICHFYEHNSRERWEKSNNCPCVRSKDGPKHYVFLVKYLMSLITGLATGFWVWGTKTVESWRKFASRLCATGKQKVPKAVAL